MESAAGSNQTGKDGWLRYVFEYINPDIIRYFAKPHIRRVATVDVVAREQGRSEVFTCVVLLKASGLSYLLRYPITNHIKSNLKVVFSDVPHYHTRSKHFTGYTNNFFFNGEHASRG